MSEPTYTLEQLADAAHFIVAGGLASAHSIQRRLGVGFLIATQIMEELEQRGIVSAPDPNSKLRDVLVTPDLADGVRGGILRKSSTYAPRPEAPACALRPEPEEMLALEGDLPDWLAKPAAFYKVAAAGDVSAAAPAHLRDGVDPRPLLRGLGHGQTIVASPGDGDQDTTVRVGVAYTGGADDTVALVIPVDGVAEQMEAVIAGRASHLVVSLDPAAARVVAGRLSNHADDLAPFERTAPRPAPAPEPRDETAVLVDQALAVITAAMPADLDEAVEVNLRGAAEAMVKAGWRPSPSA
jgi:hypothetical protein